MTMRLFPRPIHNFKSAHLAKARFYFRFIEIPVVIIMEVRTVINFSCH